MEQAIKDRIALQELKFNRVISQCSFRTSRIERMQLCELEEGIKLMHTLLRREIGWWNYIKYLITK